MLNGTTKPGAVRSPRDFLRDLLSAGPMCAADVFKDADSNGYSKGQMHRAKSALGVLAEKLSMRGGWEWSLPKVPVGHEDTGRCRAQILSIFDTFGGIGRI